MGAFISQNDLFSPLPEPKAPWREFGFGLVTQGLLCFVLLMVGLLHPEILSTPEHNYRTIALVDNPPPVSHQPQPVRVLPQPETAPIDPPKADLRLPAPQPKPKLEVEKVEAPAVTMTAKKLDSLPPTPAVVIPRAPVKTNVFSTGSSATPTIARAPSQVQTGGFGDPNGVPAHGTEGKAVNIAQLGSFDLPAGPGYGNGTGGAKGVRGVVASTGFGNGVATGDSNGRVSNSRAAVRQSGFGDADVQAAPVAKSRPVEAAKTVPAEILSKPNPVYTEEARNLRIEGEVLVEAVLEASGKLHIVRVIRGLGHGLDDSAVRAAEQIRFKPALRDGQPTDSTAVLHIVFQLA
jgi:TonB family protein